MLSVHAAGERGGASTRIARNFSFRLVSQVMSALINVAGLALLGNYLHAEGYGQYAFYYSLIPLIGALGDLGVGIILTREMARDEREEPRLYGDALLLKAAISGTLLVVTIATAWIFFDAPRAWLVSLVAAAALIEIGQDPVVWRIRARERQDLEALLLMVSQVGWILGLAVGAWLHLPLSFLLATATVAFLIRLGVGAALVARLGTGPEIRWDAARLGRWVRQGLPFGLAMFGVVLYGRVGVLLLQWLSTSKDVAFFNVAYMLSQPLGFISTALTMSAFPVIARYAKHDPQKLRDALRKTSKYQIVVTLPMVVGLYLLSERVIPLLFHGDDFQSAGTALKIMSLGLTVIFLNLMARYVLAALERQQDYLKSIVAGFVVNAALCFALIPRFGFLGAIVAYLAAELAILCVCQWTLRRFVPVLDLLRDSVRPFLAAAGMGLVVVGLRAMPLALVVFLGAVVYGGLLVVFQVLSPKEISILKGAWVSFRLPGSAYLSRAGQRS